MIQPFLLGVNYWPQKKGVNWWSDFDAGEVREEFAIIRELGMTIVRIFLFWEDFQPKPGEISTNSLNHLVTVCDIADELKLKLDITFFTGHMSGSNFSPAWMLQEVDKPAYIQQVVSEKKVVDKWYLNPFSEAKVIESEKLQLRAVVQLLKNHPAIYCWNLGNEPDIFAFPPNDVIGEKWAVELVKTIREIDNRNPVTCGLHIASLLYNNGLRIDQIFQVMDFAVMHAYPMYMMGFVKEPLDVEFVPFTCALTAALSGKPVLMEEFGGCTAPPGKDSFEWEWIGYSKEMKQFMASEEALADYFAAVLPKLVEVGAIGAMSWCFADFHPDLWEVPPYKESRHERFFGLLRLDGSLKPHAKVIREFSATNPIVKPASRVITLPYHSSDYYVDTLEKILNLYEDWTKSK